MVKPWADAGYNCVCVDIKHKGIHTDKNVTYIGSDLHRWKMPNGNYIIAFAFPPCTDLAISGARWFVDKGIDRLYESIRLVKRCVDLCKSTGAPWMIENPVGIMNSYWPPKYRFDPHQFAGYLENNLRDAYTKKTCIWIGNGFRFPKYKSVKPILGSKMHLLPPSPHRANRRSQTPRGFAQAVFIANQPTKKHRENT
jgi:hypothetical protein